MKNILSFFFKEKAPVFKILNRIRLKRDKFNPYNDSNLNIIIHNSEKDIADTNKLLASLITMLKNNDRIVLNLNIRELHLYLWYTNGGCGIENYKLLEEYIDNSETLLNIYYDNIEELKNNIMEKNIRIIRTYVKRLERTLHTINEQID